MYIIILDNYYYTIIPDTYIEYIDILIIINNIITNKLFR